MTRKKKQKYDEERASRAGSLCESYRIRQGGAYVDEPDTAIIRDILADLMHLAALHGDDFDAAMTTARINYESEA